MTSHCQPRPPPSAGLREWSGLVVLALPTLLLGLDVTVLYLVVPSMAAELEPSATQSLWIMDVYGFVIAGLLITMGTLGDRIGRRKLLLIGMVAFAGASVFAAFAPTAEALIVARALLGVAGATLMPSTLSLISNMFHDVRQRAVAIGVWATMFALGMAAGPIVGGLMVDAWWWGAAFLLAVPVAALVLIAGPLLLPEYADRTAGRIDLSSVLLSLAALLPLIYAIKQVAAYGPDPVSLAAGIVGIAAGAAFWRRQRRLDDPLLDVTLFAHRGFSAALLILLVGLVGVGGAMYLVTQYLQLVEGLGPFTAGLWMGPPAVAMFIAAVGAPLVARRIRPGRVMSATLALSLIGYLLLATAGLDDEVRVAAGFALVYLGLGANAALGTDIVVGTAPAIRSGSAASMSETVQELGIALGVAVLGSLTTAVYRGLGPVESHRPSTDHLDARASDSLAGALAVEDHIPADAMVAAREAFTSGMNVSALVAALAVTGAAVVSWRMLRSVPRLGE